MSTEARVKKIINDHMFLESVEVTDGTNLMDELHADSLDVIELVQACEQEFQIEVPDREIENILTVGDIVKTVDKYANGAK